jgi:tuftelin-interacting protein 11
VRAQLNYALDLMNSAVDGAPLPPYQPPLQAGTAAGTAGASYGAAGPAPAPSVAPYSAAAAELTLKDLVQRFAEEAGVDFLPKPGRSVDGQPVFLFGSVSVLLDAVQGAIRAQIRDRWAPVSLERLLQEHKSRAGAQAR